MKKNYLIYVCLIGIGLFWTVGIPRAQVLDHSISSYGSGSDGEICDPPARLDSCFPEPRIVRQLPRYARGWVGSVSWHDGIIYEVTDSTAGFAIQKDAQTGAELGRLNFSEMGDMQGISYDPWNDSWWVKPHGLQGAIEYNWNGGKTGRRISTRSYAAQIFVDPDERDVIWVGHSVKTGILKIDTTNDKLLKQIPTSFGVRSVVRIGNDFWCTRAGEVGEKGILIKVNSSGQEICRYYMPSAKYEHDTGGCSLDDKGYLWVEGGKGTSIYRLDIGYSPITPPPSPPPTPAPTPSPPRSGDPILDSGDYNGDGTSDLAVFRPATGLWSVRGVTRFYFGKNGDIPVVGDYDGDGTTDPAVFRPRRGLWVVRNLTGVTFGGGEDIPIPGDYNGDGTCDIGVFRANSGLWGVRGLTRIYFGSTGDWPVPGYYTGSAAKDLAVFRPPTGLWIIRDLTRTHFGRVGDYPVPGDYSGAGRDEIAIYRPRTQFWAVRGLTRAYFARGSGQPQPGDYQGDGVTDPAVFNSLSGQWRLQGNTTYYFGQPGDCPAAAAPPRSGQHRRSVIDSGDYNGDGTSEIALFRDSEGLWAIRDGAHTDQIHFGKKGDLPVSGDYDGDGKSDIAIYRPSSGLWSVRAVTRFYLGGGAGDLPIPGDYNGDGTCDSAIFNHRTALWQVRIEIPFSSRTAAEGFFGDQSVVLAVPPANPRPGKKLDATAPFTFDFQYGLAGDIPIPGNYGDGSRKVIAVYRPSNGFWGIRGITQFHYGQAGDFPLPGDFNGDGISAAGVFRPRQRLWAIRGVTRIYYGVGDDSLPVPADYRGDGTTEVGIFRSRIGRWQIRGLTRVYFGQAGDTPAVGASVGAESR